MAKIVNFSKAKKEETKKAFTRTCWQDKYDIYNFTVDPSQFKTEAEFNMCLKQFLFLEELYNSNEI